MVCGGGRRGGGEGISRLHFFLRVFSSVFFFPSLSLSLVSFFLFIFFFLALLALFLAQLWSGNVGRELPYTSFVCHRVSAFGACTAISKLLLFK